MGQYHKLYNLDRKEMVHGHDIDNGLKLLEQVGCVKCTSTALFLLVSNSNDRGSGDAPAHSLIGSWAGDRIVVQGDYAEPSDKGFVSEDDKDLFKNISATVLEMLNLVEDVF